jgi:hypothetical protein
MYFKQNSHIHILPSGMFAYSSGNGASYQVLISNWPKRMVRMRRVGSELGVGIAGVEAEGDGEAGEVVERVATCCNVDDRSGRKDGPATGKSVFSDMPRVGGSGGGGGVAIFCSDSILVFSNRCLSVVIMLVLEVSRCSGNKMSSNKPFGGSSSSRSFPLRDCGIRSLIL